MIFKRQKLLLQVVKRLSEKGVHSRIYLVKALFLLRRKFGFGKVAYDFFPYKYGPFSNEIYQDFNFLEAQGLFDESKLCLMPKGEELVKNNMLASPVLSELDKIILEYAGPNAIKSFVYEKFPEFAFKSEKMQKKEPSGKGTYSIGYEGKTIDCFLNELVQERISLLVDVRRNAFSMKRNFSKKRLESYLGKAGIGYLHLPALGIESEKRKNLKSKQDFEELFEEYKKTLGLKKAEIALLEGLAEKQKIALMCFEADKNNCHRGILSKKLEELTDLKVMHL